MAEHATGDRWQYRNFTSTDAYPHNGMRWGNVDHPGGRDDAGDGLGSAARPQVADG
ncbi:hypothetical protein V2J67_22950 [Pseudomonas alliivorans]|nr:hypothetical protein [Pseudomonas alliivorans]